MLVSVEHLSKMQNVRAIVDDVSFAIEEKACMRGTDIV